METLISVPQILQNIHDTLSEFTSEIGSLFSFFTYVNKAIQTTYQYVGSLPDYLQATCYVIIGISIIYLIVGR